MPTYERKTERKNPAKKSDNQEIRTRLDTMQTTAVIKYNLKDRGRKYRGKERNFDIASIVRHINSPETQERIKNRDMLGFYGHWARIKYGMNPLEGGIDKNKPFYIEPALVTTYLKGYPDGTIEHQAQFLDTDSGKTAAKLYSSRVGGFSSAIEMGPTDSKFFGFDYVFEPNYTTNRGYRLSLDSANGGGYAYQTFDSVEEAEEAAKNMQPGELDETIKAEQLRGILALLDSADMEKRAAAETINALSREKQELMREIERAEIRHEQELEDARAKYKNVMDSIAIGAGADDSAAKRLLRDIAQFHTSSLPQFVEEGLDARSPRDDPAGGSPIYQHFINRIRR